MAKFSPNEPDAEGKALSTAFCIASSLSLSKSLFDCLSLLRSLFVSVLFPYGSRSPALLGFALRFFCLFSYSLVFFLVLLPSE